MHSPTPLYVRRLHFKSREDAAFNGDLMERDKVAEKLNRYIDRLSEGCTIAIDAPWGAGKTWFGLHWEKQLRERDGGGHKTIYVDAFEHDYVEDPFTVLASAIYKCISEDQDAGSRKSSFSEKAAAALKVLEPGIGKLLVQSVAIGITKQLGIDGVAKDIADKIGEALADEAHGHLAKQIEAADENQRKLQAFRQALTEFAATQKRPIVFFVDELDRCKPDFAVKLVERVKHLFNVPNLVFVLLLNREQLEHAIHGVYGQGVAASDYLGKFIHLFFSLPSHDAPDRSVPSKNLRFFVGETLKMYRYDAPGWEYVVAPIAIAALRLSLTLRDVEKCIALTIIGLEADTDPFLTAWVSALKVKEPARLRAILAGDRDANLWAANKLEGLRHTHEKAEVALAHHTCIALGDEAPESHKNIIFQWSIQDAKEHLRLIARELDLEVS